MYFFLSLGVKFSCADLMQMLRECVKRSEFISYEE